jgi:acetoin utilization deacetylase AcuC-like enzyme
MSTITAASVAGNAANSWQALGVGTTPLVVFSGAEHDAHMTHPHHPEHPRRLDAALAGVAAAELGDATEWRQPPEATDADLALVHDELYVDAVRRFCECGGGHLDPDTIASPGSFSTAKRAAGGVLAAVDALRAGECDVAFSAARPPGHHALPDRAMGFCLFNNVAIAAARLADEGQRVAIVDWDVHHGNGTQHIFYDDPRVLYVSTHEAPLYPGTGKLAETGGQRAPNTNLNLPFPAGTRGDVYRAAFDEVVVPVVESFAPDWLIISAGFDGHRDDPLASIELTSADYADFAARLAALVPARRVVVALEGGYDLDALTHSVGATLAALIGSDYRPEPASTGEIGRPTIVAARQLWGLD